MSLPPNRNLFAEFKGTTRVFVETGSWRGDGIQAALDAGFEKIISIDIDPANIEFCKNRFPIEQRTGRIYLYTDDTGNQGLYNAIKEIDEPIMFWLDAHRQYLENEVVGANPWPLFRELLQIGLHTLTHGQAHTILIDDILMLTHPDVTGWKKEQIEQALFEINCGFNLRYVANPINNNLLVAYV
jgi:hypothetical protein